jgi:hypothetical protein
MGCENQVTVTGLDEVLLQEECNHLRVKSVLGLGLLTRCTNGVH